MMTINLNGSFMNSFPFLEFSVRILSFFYILKSLSNEQQLFILHRHLTQLYKLNIFTHRVFKFFIAEKVPFSISLRLQLSIYLIRVHIRKNR